MGGGRRLHARADPELGQDPRYVHAGGLLGHEQRLADLAVRAAVGDQLEDGALALGEAERVELRWLWRRRRRRSVERDPRPAGEALDLGREQLGPQLARQV